MATLTGQTVASTYDLLLKVNTSGIDGTLRTIQDGVAANSALELSTGAVKSTGTLTVDGVSTLTGVITATGGVTGNLTGTVTAASVLANGVTATTQSAGNNSTKVATTAYVDSQVETSDTLAEVLANGNTTGSTNIIVSASQSITTDTISETTSAAGVTIDSVLVKDNSVTATTFTGDVTGDVKADDGAAIVASGADLANSSIGNGVTATTQSYGDGSTKVATTAYVDSAVPTATIVQFAGVDTTTSPDGWLFCHGSAVSRTTYAALFLKISTFYGVGDGATTFNVPDFRGRVALGWKSGDSDYGTLGNTGGSKTHTLTESEMPAHTHTITRGTASGTPGIEDYTNGNFGPGATSSTGGGAAHENRQPYLVVNWMIKA